MPSFAPSSNRPGLQKSSTVTILVVARLLNQIPQAPRAQNMPNKTRALVSGLVPSATELLWLLFLFWFAGLGARVTHDVGGSLFDTRPETRSTFSWLLTSKEDLATKISTGIIETEPTTTHCIGDRSSFTKRLSYYALLVAHNILA